MGRRARPRRGTPFSCRPANGRLTNWGTRPIRRRGAPDGGAEVRFINIPGREAFPAEPGQTREDVDAFVTKLGAAASTDYGHAGPMFVKYLMAYPADAEKWIRVLLGRVAGRSRRRFCRAPRAARPGGLRRGSARSPASRRLPPKGSSCPGRLSMTRSVMRSTRRLARPRSLRPPAAMLWAFARVLEIWLGEHGGGSVSTEVAELKSELRDFYTSRKRHFHLPAALRDVNEHPPSPQWGWRVPNGPAGESSSAPPTSMCFPPRSPTAWRSTGRRPNATGSSAGCMPRGCFIPGADKLQSTRWDGEGNRRVYRIKGTFFEG